jgi:SAM-dependent MidA family methyltransferase
MPLPLPDAVALEQSHALADRIAAEIEASGGWIGFDRYMAMALYEPGLGYYASGTRKFGAAGDFVTAPELTPLFGHCVATQVSQWFGEAPRRVVEFGAGSGALAAQLLEGLQRLDTPADEYWIVELSADLADRQRETVTRLAPGFTDRVRWLDRMPASIEGVVVANELLDAMPARLFETDGRTLGELGVARTADGLAWALREADRRFAAAVDATLARAAGQHATHRWLAAEAGGRYRSELGEQARAWTATVAAALRHGAMLLIDYGFPAHEYYHPQRSAGTLACHYRHRVHDDPLRWPGLQDITTHVDFTAIADAALSQGLELLGYASQARFLVGCGLLERLADEQAIGSDGPRPGASIERTRGLAAVQSLLSEAEMGELFKVAAFGRGIAAPAIGFQRGDRSASLLPAAGMQ